MALAIVLVIVLESGASVQLVAPNPVANSCSLDSPLDIGLAMCQCKHQALAASNTGLWQEHRARCG